MTAYRLSHAAREDIVDILRWSHDQFGAEARTRYEALIVAAIRDVAERAEPSAALARPELGDGVVVWHLARSRSRSRGGLVRRPRHILVCRLDGGVVVVGRVLHDAMDPQQHVERERTWQ